MSSIIKSISLDLKTAAIAKKVPNFSRFVRECLLRWEAIHREPDCPVERMGHPLIGEHCVPSKGRICLKHWPKGTPSMDDWRIYRDMVEYHEYHNDTDRLIQTWPFLEAFTGMGAEPQYWIAHRAELLNRDSIDFDNMVIEGNAKPEKKKAPSRGWRRILAFLQRE